MKYIVHYGAMRLLGVFSHADLVFQYGNRVVVKTPRGQEVGTVRCEADPDIVAKLDKGFVEDRILRSMTESDEIEFKKIRNLEQKNLERCRQIIQESETVMDLVRVEHTFGSERMVVYYTADGRIDFRELVKVLSAEFQTRIEMRQINVREKMRLLPHIGDCGREICCG
jgi:cell fate regulator YaaT (PSP1 superfamily)